MAETTKGRHGEPDAHPARDSGGRDSGDKSEAYWRENFRSRPYVDANTGYVVYHSAYKYGAESRKRHPGKKWRDVEAVLEAGWATARDDSDLDWSVARNACRDAWDHIDQFMRE
jgi:hypothetical protein